MPTSQPRHVCYFCKKKHVERKMQCFSNLVSGTGYSWACKYVEYQHHGYPVYHDCLKVNGSVSTPGH